MNLVSKICILIILMCIGGVLYVSYNFMGIMGQIEIFTPGKIIKEMMYFIVFIVLFGMVTSTTVKILIKQKKFEKELSQDKWSA